MKVIQFVNGIPKTVNLTGTVNFYEATVPVTTAIGVAGTGYDANHLVFTLPNSQTYDGTKNVLLVYLNGVLQESGVDFNYTNSSSATTVTFLSAVIQSARVQFLIGQ